jgi:hypothetical protein
MPAHEGAGMSGTGDPRGAPRTDEEQATPAHEEGL